MTRARSSRGDRGDPTTRAAGGDATARGSTDSASRAEPSPPSRRRPAMPGPSRPGRPRRDDAFRAERWPARRRTHRIGVPAEPAAADPAVAPAGPRTVGRAHRGRPSRRRRALRVHGPRRVVPRPARRARGAGIRVVATRHEGGAAFMAEAHGQLTGRPAVCLGTRAVGASNLAIGIHTARQDSTPMFVVVGQVERAAVGARHSRRSTRSATIGGLAKWAAEPRAAADVAGSHQRGAPPGARRASRAGPPVAPRGPSRRADARRRKLDTPAGPARGPPTTSCAPSSSCSPRRGDRSSSPARHPARSDLDRAAPFRRTAPGAGHRRLAPRGRHLERPSAVSRHVRARQPGVRQGAARRRGRAVGHRLPAQRSDLLAHYAFPT